jgi:biopolymer transport protein ExbD
MRALALVAVLLLVGCRKGTEQCPPVPDPAVIASAVPLDMPKAPDASADAPTAVSLVILADGKMMIDGKDVDDAGLRAALADAKERNPDVRVVIKADKDARHGRVIYALDVAKQVGIGRIAFGVTPIEK